MNFEDVVIIITGASKGIGNTLANILTKYQAKVVGIYNKTNIKNAKFMTYKCDITSEKMVKKMIEDVYQKYHKIDVVVNCAALCHDEDMYLKTKKNFMQVLETNLVGTFLVCKYASLKMPKGVIINVSSTDATDTYSVLSMDYAASKAGLENLTKNLAKRLPNLKICALAPAWVDTQSVLDMDPKFLKGELERLGQKQLLRKEDVAIKIIEMIINNDDYLSGDIVRMEENYE